MLDDGIKKIKHIFLFKIGDKLLSKAGCHFIRPVQNTGFLIIMIMVVRLTRLTSSEVLLCIKTGGATMVHSVGVKSFNIPVKVE